MDVLYQAIQQAQNAEPQAMRAAEAALQEMLKQPGVLRHLQAIAMNQSLDLKARQLAIIQAKNHVQSQWKVKTKTPDEDLVVMRQNMLNLLGEPDEIIVKNNQSMTARAVRLDYPANRWPGIFEQLTGLIQTQVGARFQTSTPEESTLVLSRRSLGMLNAILKEFGSLRGPMGTNVNTKVTGLLFPILTPLVSETTTFLQNRLNPTTVRESLTAHDIEICRLSWKCRIKIMLWAWAKAKKITSAEEQAFTEFFAAAATTMQQLWGYRTSIAQALSDGTIPPEGPTLQCLELLTKCVKSFGKAFRRMQQTSIQRFVALANCSDVVLFYWNKVVEATSAPEGSIADTPHAVYPVPLMVQGLAIFKESLAQWSPSKKGASMDMGDGNGTTLSSDFVTGAVTILITRFLPLKPSDLEAWEEDPEEFLVAEDKENELWEFDIRPCSERVLMTLATQYPDYVAPLLQQLYQTVVFNPPADLNAILQREAVYCALGRCVHRVKNLIDFNEWLSILAQEARNPNPQYRLMKRRIAWLVGKWHFDDTGNSSVNNQVWEILLFFLTDKSEGSDSVVRLTSVTALFECVENIDFSIDGFQPFLAGFLGALFPLIDEADTVEMKGRIFKTINVIIGHARERIVPLIPAITAPIPAFWTAAGNEFMLKQSLLILARELVLASGPQSVATYSLIVPLLRESMAPGAKSQLDEDALGLWEAAIRNCPSFQVAALGDASLMDLLPLLVESLGSDMDILSHSTRLLESYYLVDANAVLQLCAPQLLAAYASAHTVVIATSIKDITESLELLIQLSESALLWAQSIHASGLFVGLLKYALAGKGSVAVLCDHFYVFSRMMLLDAEVFMQLLVEASATRSESAEQTIDSFMDAWWRHFDSMAEPRHRKMTAMAMASLATTGRPEVIKRLPTEIANVWMDVLGEIKEAESDDPDNPSPLHTYWSGEEDPPLYWMRACEDTLEEARRKAVWKQDPVKTIKLTSYLDQKLKATSTKVGPAVWQTEFLDKADPTVVKQLMDALAN